MISYGNWWPWTKPGYITMIRGQSNNQWSGGIVAHPAPKNSECKNLLEKFLPRFFGLKTASSSFIIFQTAKWVLLISAGATEGHFEGKTPWEVHQRRSCSCKTMHQLIGHLQPRRKWPTWASNVFITHPILRIWPRRTNACSLDWKKIEMSPFFVQSGGHCCRGDLVGRTSFWFFFWVACKS